MLQLHLFCRISRKIYRNSISCTLKILLQPPTTLNYHVHFSSPPKIIIIHMPLATYIKNKSKSCCPTFVLSQLLQLSIYLTFVPILIFDSLATQGNVATLLEYSYKFTDVDGTRKASYSALSHQKEVKELLGKSVEAYKNCAISAAYHEERRTLEVAVAIGKQSKLDVFNLHLLAHHDDNFRTWN